MWVYVKRRLTILGGQRWNFRYWKSKQHVHLSRDVRSRMVYKLWIGPLVIALDTPWKQEPLPYKGWTSQDWNLNNEPNLSSDQTKQDSK
jgi:hypothetical protein